VATIEAEGGRVHGIVGDVSVEADAERMVEETVAAFGGIDILVNNAAHVTRGTLLHELPTDEWDRTFATNLRGPFITSRTALRTMLRGQGDRAIVNVSSDFAYFSMPGIAAYSATKGGLVTLTRALAIEYADEGIRVNAVSVGLVHTPIAFTGLTDEDRVQREAVYPLGLGRPEDVASAITYLASEESGWITGTVLDVDGGLAAKSPASRQPPPEAMVAAAERAVAARQRRDKR
jgi:NAD(P)-dependent dehydrogenase (short-subunit alcohol dehydrogenase family)